ncbi:MAG: tyrosine-type recombinase/integrase [Aureispira sp.]
MAENLIPYRPCVLSKDKTNIYYYALHPEGGLRRKRKYVKRFKGNFKRTAINHIKKTINEKLATGWSPFMEQEASASTTLLSVALARFIKDKESYCRKDSMRSIYSILGYWQKHVEHNNPLFMCLQVDANYAKALMRYLTERKNIGPKTYNNYRRWFSTFCNWCISEGYMNANPFNEVKPKRLQPKSRKLIPDPVLAKILNHYQNHHPGMALFVNMVLYIGLRPHEILQLKPSYFRISEKTVFLPIEASKSHRGSARTIPDRLMNDVVAWLNQCGTNDFLFSTRMKPGTQQKDTRYADKFWTTMRKKLHLPMEYKLYSCRDTGIVYMLNKGVPPHVVQRQFGHSDLKFTSIYSNHLTTTAHPHLLSL